MKLNYALRKRIRLRNVKLHLITKKNVIDFLITLIKICLIIFHIKRQNTI